MGKFIAWWSGLFSDPSGLPDEARVGFVFALSLYLLLWTLWAVSQGLSTWPKEITPFVGGLSGISGAFGVTVWLRGNK
ncbi:hypothetical protein [Petrachloros mirabilis]